MPSRSSSSSNVQAIDDLLAAGGLSRGRRLLRGEGWERRRRGTNPEDVPRQTPRRVIKSQIEIVRAAGWDAWPWLLHGFSTRTGGATTAYRPAQRSGELNLGFSASDTHENVLENRRRLMAALRSDAGAELVTLRQIHSSLVRRVGREDAAREQPWKGDGMMTDERSVVLAVQNADC